MNAPTTSHGPDGFWQRVRDQEWFLLLVSPRNLLRGLLALGAVDLLCLNMWAVPSALEQTYVRSPKGYIVVNAAGPDAVLVLLVSPQAKLGLIFLEMKRTIAELQKLL